MKKCLLALASISALLLVSACSSHPVIPEKDDIKVSREAPDSDCKSLGMIEGRTKKIKGTAEDALDDMKGEAIKKGANYVKMEMMGAQGTSVRGEAFFCD